MVHFLCGGDDEILRTKGQFHLPEVGLGVKRMVALSEFHRLGVGWPIGFHAEVHLELPMDSLAQAVEHLTGLFPSALVLALIMGAYWLTRRWFETSTHGLSADRTRRQLTLSAISLAGLLMMILVLPLGDSMRGQLLSLIGLLLSAAIALASTTLIGNALAGLMLRAVRGFRMGDFIKVGEHFGRVSERGLFHVEIQTEDRDLTTLPNILLATNPVSVIRTSGTVMSATVSLGYDIPHARIEALLLQAAEQADLQEPFVQVIELGDFSVIYRVAGVLTEIKGLLSARSRLRTQMLDALHEGGVEIVSPTFMNTRAITPERRFIPRRVNGVEEENSGRFEAMIFDKAEEAESVERLKLRLDALKEQIEALQDALKSMEGDEKVEAEAKRGRLTARMERLVQIIAAREEDLI